MENKLGLSVVGARPSDVLASQNLQTAIAYYPQGGGEVDIRSCRDFFISSLQRRGALRWRGHALRALQRRHRHGMHAGVTVKVAGVSARRRTAVVMKNFRSTEGETGRLSVL